MKNSIVHKLSAFLTEPVDTEPKAVYLMCEVRKLLEAGPPHELFTLKMYCHWALHVKLDHPSTTRDFMALMDRLVNSVLVTGSIDIVKEHEVIMELVYFDKLKTQLREVLSSHGLPTLLCDEQEWWYGFLKAYAGVVDESVLTIRGDSSTTEFVRQVTFERRVPNVFHNLLFEMGWRSELHDGRTLLTTIAPLADPRMNRTTSVGHELIVPQTPPQLWHGRIVRA